MVRISKTPLSNIEDPNIKNEVKDLILIVWGTPIVDREAQEIVSAYEQDLHNNFIGIRTFTYEYYLRKHPLS